MGVGRQGCGERWGSSFSSGLVGRGWGSGFAKAVRVVATGSGVEAAGVHRMKKW